MTGLVRVARWGLPLLGILMISATAAFAMTVALAPALPAGDQPTSLAVQQARATDPATTLRITSSIDPGVDVSAGTYAFASTINAPAGDQLSSDEACATSGPMVYVGLNAWIHDPNVPCQDDTP